MKASHAADYLNLFQAHTGQFTGEAAVCGMESRNPQNRLSVIQVKRNLSPFSKQSQDINQTKISFPSWPDNTLREFTKFALRVVSVCTTKATDCWLS